MRGGSRLVGSTIGAGLLLLAPSCGGSSDSISNECLGAYAGTLNSEGWTGEPGGTAEAQRKLRQACGADFDPRDLNDEDLVRLINNEVNGLTPVGWCALPFRTSSALNDLPPPTWIGGEEPSCE